MQHLLILGAVILAGLPAMALPRVLRGLLLHAAAGRRESVLALIGLTAGAVGYARLNNRASRFWRVLHHEVAHAFVALLMLASPSSLVVEGTGGGHIKYAIGGPLAFLRTFLIGIAPYCLSPVAVLAGFLLMLVPVRGPSVVLAAAVAVGFGLAATLMEISPRQSDLRQRGFVFASACSLWLWCAVAAVLLQCLLSSDPITAVASTYQLGSTELIRAIGLVADKGMSAAQSW